MVSLGQDGRGAARARTCVERLPTLAEALDAFLIDLTIEGRSPATVRTYRSLLKLPDVPLADLTPELCRRLIGARMHQSQATARGFAAALASFTRFCALAYGVPNAMEKVPKPRVRPKPHRFLSRDQLRALWLACPDDHYRLMLLLLGTGLRAGEAVALRHADVEGDTATVRGKGGRYRRIVLSDALLRFLADSGNAESVLGYGYDELRRRVRHLGVLAKIPYRVNPHALRHAFASNALLEGMDVLTLQQLGGWSSAQMISQVYGRSAMEEAALRRARAFKLSERLFQDPETT